MEYKYIMYFSTELDGKGYKIGKQNFEHFVEIMFDGLDVVSTSIDESEKIFIIVSKKRLSQQMLNDRRSQGMFRFKSGTLVQVYMMCEMS